MDRIGCGRFQRRLRLACAGFGLGGALPLDFSLTSESLPRHDRAVRARAPARDPRALGATIIAGSLGGAPAIFGTAFLLAAFVASCATETRGRALDPVQT